MRGFGILAGAMLLCSVARAQTPADPATTPSPAATPNDGDAETVAIPPPERITVDDGLRDGRADAHHAGLFAKKPAIEAGVAPEYLRGYDKGFRSVAHHRRANAAVVGGFGLILVGLGVAAWAQSQSGGDSGAIQPIGLRF